MKTSLRLPNPGHALAISLIAASAAGLTAAEPVNRPMRIPLVGVNYFPTNGTRIDLRVTGDWDAPLADTVQKTERQTREAMEALEQGSRYHAFKDPQAKPSLRYEVLKVFTFH